MVTITEPSQSFLYINHNTYYPFRYGAFYYGFWRNTLTSVTTPGYLWRGSICIQSLCWLLQTRRNSCWCLCALDGVSWKKHCRGSITVTQLLFACEKSWCLRELRWRELFSRRTSLCDMFIITTVVWTKLSSEN